ncbi:glycosyltransferase family 2 protein [Propionibacteriaceae bacterium Y1685]
MDADSTTWPGVSVVMPVRNEEPHLRAAVERVLDQRYPGELELIMAVGPSEDDTAGLAERLVAEHPGTVAVVDNPAGRTPAGLNLAVARARHDIVVRVDGHGELTDNYITTAVELLQRTGAVNVGGVMDAHGRTAFEEAVATGYNTRLGLGGGTFHLEDSPEGPADTVFLGVFRKEALLALGGFDEGMHRAQDWELNYRLRQAGGTVWFSPKLKVTYRPRSTPRALAKQFFETGRWRREVIRRHPDTASVRYLAAPVAVTGIAVGTVLGLIGSATRSWLRIGWAAPLGYAAIITTGSLLVKGISPAARARLPFVYGTMHLAWGSGFLVGLDADQRTEEEPDEPGL